MRTLVFFLAYLLLLGCRATQPLSTQLDPEQARADSINLASLLAPSEYPPMTASAARQYRKNLWARAAADAKKLKAEAKLAQAQQPTVPKRLSKGAVWAPGNTGKIAAGNRPGQAVAADSASVVDQSDAGTAAYIPGSNNQLTQDNAPVEARGWQAEIAHQLTGPVGIVLGVAAAGALLYGVVALWKRRKAKQVLDKATDLLT